jgi:hypothetical protein
LSSEIIYRSRWRVIRKRGGCLLLIIAWAQEVKMERNSRRKEIDDGI